MSVNVLGIIFDSRFFLSYQFTIPVLRRVITFSYIERQRCNTKIYVLSMAFHVYYISTHNICLYNQENN